MIGSRVKLWKRKRRRNKEKGKEKSDKEVKGEKW